MGRIAFLETDRKHLGDVVARELDIAGISLMIDQVPGKEPVLHSPKGNAYRGEESIIRYALSMSGGRLDLTARREWTCKQLDELYDSVDDLLRENKFDEVDQMLQDVNLRQAGVIKMIGYLTITFPVRSALAYRSKFYEAVRQELIALGRNADALLKGLEDPNSSSPSICQPCEAT